MKKRIKNLIALFIGLILAFGLGEVVLRLIPNHFTNYNSTVQYSFDAFLGYTLTPGQRSVFNMACFRNDAISVNSHGFRDTEWRGGKQPKIGILGDSFMEALQVPDDSTTAARLEKRLGIEVLNTGLSGFGTVGEAVIWERHLKVYRPDVLLLFYYPPNDLINNHCQLNQKTHNAFVAPCPCAMPGSLGPVLQDDFLDTLPTPGWFTQHSMFARAILGAAQFSGSVPKAAQTFDAYRKPYTGEWAEAQEITRYTLDELNQSAKSVGSRLVVVTVPSYISQAHDWEEDLMRAADWDKLPQDFDREYPNQVIRELCDSLEVPIWELEPVFRAYRDKNSLPDPTFFFTCNGHWNSLGHQLAAKTVADRITEAGWLTSFPEQD